MGAAFGCEGEPRGPQCSRTVSKGVPSPVTLTDETAQMPAEQIQSPRGQSEMPMANNREAPHFVIVHAPPHPPRPQLEADFEPVAPLPLIAPPGCRGDTESEGKSGCDPLLDVQQAGRGKVRNPLITLVRTDSPQSSYTSSEQLVRNSSDTSSCSHVVGSVEDNGRIEDRNEHDTPPLGTVSSRLWHDRRTRPSDVRKGNALFSCQATNDVDSDGWGSGKSSKGELDSRGPSSYAGAAPADSVQEGGPMSKLAMPTFFHNPPSTLVSTDDYVQQHSTVSPISGREDAETDTRSDLAVGHSVLDVFYDTDESQYCSSQKQFDLLGTRRPQVDDRQSLRTTFTGAAQDGASGIFFFNQNDESSHLFSEEASSYCGSMDHRAAGPMSSFVKPRIVQLPKFREQES